MGGSSHSYFIVTRIVHFNECSRNKVPPSGVCRLERVYHTEFFVISTITSLGQGTVTLLSRIFPRCRALFASVFKLASSRLLHGYSAPRRVVTVRASELYRVVSIPDEGQFKVGGTRRVGSLTRGSFNVIRRFSTFNYLVGRCVRRVHFSRRRVTTLSRHVTTLCSSFSACLDAVPNMNPMLKTAVLDRVNSVSHFSSTTGLTTFTNVSPAIGRSNRFIKAQGRVSGHNSPCLEETL